MESSRKVERIHKNWMNLSRIPGYPGLQTFSIKTLLGDLASPHSYERSGNRGAVLGLELVEQARCGMLHHAIARFESDIGGCSSASRNEANPRGGGSRVRSQRT